MIKRLLPVLCCAALAMAQDFKLGEAVSDFTVQDLNGASVPFSSLRGDTTVVIFISRLCPISNAYNDRMIALYAKYMPKGVKFVFVNSNQNEPAKDVAEHAHQVGFTFPVYKDLNNVVADHFGAQSTPESYVIDKAGVIRYHGYIDDSVQPARVKIHGLEAAVDALMEGKPIAQPRTRAFGCTIKRVRRSS